MSESPLRRLAAQTLRPLKRKPSLLDDTELELHTFRDARLAGVEAITGSGVGPDLYAGERILAAAQLIDRPKGHEHRLAIAITDRRTAVSGWSSIGGPMTLDKERWSVPHASLTRVEVKSGMLATGVFLEAGTTKHSIGIAELVPILGPFYQALTSQIAPLERVEPPTTFLAPSEADPSGARDAAATLWTDDAATTQILATIDHNVREAGMPVDVARDLAARVVLAHRTAASAPMTREGRWLSPMSAQDLGGTLVKIFGPPMGHAQPQPGVEQLDFRIDPRNDVLGAAVRALGVASHVALGIGLSPGKAIAGALLKKQQVTHLRVMFTDQQGASAYRLFAPPRELETCDSRLALKVHLALAASSYSVLARRAERGWAVPYAGLFT